MSFLVRNHAEIFVHGNLSIETWKKNMYLINIARNMSGNAAPYPKMAGNSIAGHFWIIASISLIFPAPMRF